MERYFVEFVPHNADKDAWNYKQTKIFATLDKARKEYHNILSTYINYGALDLVTVYLMDSHKAIKSETWEKPVEVVAE